MNVAGLWLRAPPSKVVPAMPRYFFNTRIGDELISDPEGEELRDPDQAWEIARAMIRELLKLEGAEGGLLNATLEVTDDAGEIVLEFPFTEAILDMSARPPPSTERQRLAGWPSADNSDCVSARNIDNCRAGKPPARTRARG